MPKATMLTAEEWRVAVDELASAASAAAVTPNVRAQPLRAPAPSLSESADFTVRAEPAETAPNPAYATGSLPPVDEPHASDPAIPQTDRTQPDLPPPNHTPDPGEAAIHTMSAELLTELTERSGLFLLVDGTDKDGALIGLARDLRAAGYLVSMMPGNALTMEDLLLDLSLRLGAPRTGPGADADADPLAQLRKTASRAGTHPIIVIIAEAERLTDDVLIEFARLLPAGEEKPGPLRLILSCRTLLVDRLAMPKLRVVRDAVASERRLTRLPGGEIVAREMLRIAPLPMLPVAPLRASLAAVASGHPRRWPGRCTAVAAAVAMLLLPAPSLDRWIGADDTASRQAFSSVELPLASTAAQERTAADVGAADGSMSPAALAALTPTAGIATLPDAPATDKATATAPIPPSVTAPQAPSSVAGASRRTAMASSSPAAPKAASQPAETVIDVARLTIARVPESPAALPAPQVQAPPTLAGASGKPAATPPAPAAPKASGQPAEPVADAATVTATSVPESPAAPPAPQAPAPWSLADASGKPAVTPPPPAAPKVPSQPAETAADAATVTATSMPESPAALPAPQTQAPSPLAEASEKAAVTPPAAEAPKASGQPAETAADAATVTATGVPESPAAPPAPQAVAALAPTPGPAPAPVVRLSDTVIAELMKRGGELLEIKDIAAARLCFERAAAARVAHAATQAGKTYDPAFFREIGVSGIAPNPAKAAEWYRTAMDLGDAEAARRMQGLPAEFRK